MKQDSSRRGRREGAVMVSDRGLILLYAVIQTEAIGEQQLLRDDQKGLALFLTLGGGGEIRREKVRRMSSEKKYRRRGMILSYPLLQ